MTRLFGPLPAVAQDLALLIGRVLLGVVLIAHGWQKFHTFTLDGVAAGFDQMGVPAPKAAATFAASVELGAGVLLIAGLATTLAALLVVADMVGAWYFAHRDLGVFVDAGGWELVGLIAAAALVIAAVGAGRLSVDALVGRESTTKEAVLADR